MIKKLIEEYAPTVEAPEGIDREALLWAIYDCERYTKGNRTPRYEPSYGPGGFYYKISKAVRDEYKEWGPSACCSYSDFQLMYIVAVELGYKGVPLALDRNVVALPFVVKYLNRRVFSFPGNETVEQVADAYNSGSFRDPLRPERYIAKFVKRYDWRKEWLTKLREDLHTTSPGSAAE